MQDFIDVAEAELNQKKLFGLPNSALHSTKRAFIVMWKKDKNGGSNCTWNTFCQG